MGVVIVRQNLSSLPTVWLPETSHSKAETLGVQSLSGPPKAVARMLTMITMIVKHPIAALYLRKEEWMWQMIIGKNNQQKIIVKNSQSDEEDKVEAVFYLWQVAKSFLRQVIRSTRSTREATTFCFEEAS